MLRGKQSLHFTALCAVNRIVDMCIVNRAFSSSEYCDDDDDDDDQEAENNKGTLHARVPPSTPSTSAQGLSPTTTTTTACDITCAKEEIILVVPPQRLSKLKGEGAQRKDSTRSKGSVHSEGMRSRSGTQSEYAKPEKDTGQSAATELDPSLDIDRTPLEILTTGDPSQIMGVLHNSLTMHKRIIGARQKCTPSTRWRHCTHHCVQILSARVLTVMCHGTTVQHKVVNEGHIRTLVDSLDPNHDPVSYTHTVYLFLL